MLRNKKYKKINYTTVIDGNRIEVDVKETKTKFEVFGIKFKKLDFKNTLGARVYFSGENKLIVYDNEKIEIKGEYNLIFSPIK